jgi:Protein of unknown function (DUF2591)
MKVKVSEATGSVLDWMVAKCEDMHTGITGFWSNAVLELDENPFKYSTNWALGGPIIEREGISVLRCEDRYGVDKKGFITSKRIPVWGAVTGQNDFDTVYGSQGDNWGEAIILDPEYLAYGPTPLIAAMRCYVASKLGDEVEVPDELS